MKQRPEDRYLEIYGGGSCIDDDWSDAGRELEDVEVER